MSTNNNNYEQLIAFFVIILAKNSSMNQHGVIYCWRQVGTTVTTSIIKSWRQIANTMVATSITINIVTSTINVVTSINTCLCQHADDKSMIESTMVWLERRHFAFAVANCVFNLRFAAALLDAAATAGSCGGLLAMTAI